MKLSLNSLQVRIKKLNIRSLKIVVVAAVLVATLIPLDAMRASAATPAFVQAGANEATTGTTTTKAFTTNNTTGNLIVAYLVWNNTDTVSLSDTAGNTYASAAPRTTWNTGWSSQIFYAKNIAGGANTVTATFNTGITQFGILYIHEYSGVDKINPLDASVGAIGTGAAMSSGSLTTTADNDLLFAGAASKARVTSVGAGYTTRSTAYSNRTMDMNAGAAGSYSATATQNNTAWTLQLVAFRADGAVPDTTPPSAPAGLVATPVSTSQINLAWDPSTDNMQVAGYKVYRNGTQIDTPGTTLYQDTGLTAATTYSYTVAAYDTAGNTSAQSASVGATTQPPPNDPEAPTVELTAPVPSATVSGTVTVAANAADNTGVVGVQFMVDGINVEAEDTSLPYAISWNTAAVANGMHSLTARARDAAGNVTTSAARTVTVSNAAPSGLSAGYGFEEAIGTTTEDASGNDITGTLTNGPVWTTGKHGNGLAFDGSNDFVNVGNPNELRITGSLTVSAWINPAVHPSNDAAIVSKRNTTGFQLDTTVDQGTRTIGFKLTNSSGANMIRYGATALSTNAWYHVTGVYNASTQTMDVYLNGALDNGALVGAVTATQIDPANSVNIGQRANNRYRFNGKIDEVRIYDRAQTQTEIQIDMNTPLGAGSPTDPTPPTVSIASPVADAQVSGIVNMTAAADDNVGVEGVQFFVDGVSVGPEDNEAPFGYAWDTRTATNGAHNLTARARDAAGNVTLSSVVPVMVANDDYFQNEILATGLNLPTTIEFLPDGRMLIAELQGTIKVAAAPYTSTSSTPFLQLTNVGAAGVQQGIYDIALDPDFETNHYYYVFYTLGTPNHDRLSRFTANSTLTGTVAGSEFVLYEDPQDAHAEHHGGSVTFGNDGKIYFTTGEHFNANNAPLLTSPRGKIHRINTDGTAPTDNPFYDGSGPNVDSIWARGLRNPFRAYFDGPTNRLFVSDVGGNNYATAKEEINIGAAGANYGWPNSEGACASPCTSPLYSYAHNGRDASVTGGFVYHGSMFPSSYQGSYFFADYTQNWIRRLTFDSSGNVSGVHNFEPANGTVDGPYGDIVDLAEGPEGALYYVDLGYSDIGGDFGVSKIRRIRYIQSNQPPTSEASATPTSGAAPLDVAFSSAGSLDPEGEPLSYLWDFGDGSSSTAANPTHIYTTAGTFTARLTVSDGVNSTLATPITIHVGNAPVAAITSPTDGSFFQAGQVITFSGDATDAEDGTLPANAFTWKVDFLHAGHTHPGVTQHGSKSGTFTIPTSGHDYSGDTRYRITLTVTDSNGLTDVKSVIIWPQKVNLTFDTVPVGLTLYLDGIAMTGPFVYDTLVGFEHTIEARNQNLNGTDYTFGSWSDGGAQLHTITVPGTGQSYTATFTAN